MATPLVSVEMITYNHEPYIREAIECVLAQKTTFPFELVIGEDCSTDGTRNIVFYYQKRYPDIIRVITSDQNVGAKKNGRRAFQACRGKYIAYCEGDDFWHRNDKLQLQVDYMESHPECGLVFSDFNWHFTRKGQTIKNFMKFAKEPYPYSPQIIDIVTHKVKIRTCTVLARLELVKQVLDADKHLHQSGYFKMGDLQLWAEISLKARIHFINESLATYQMLEESATQSRDKLKALRFWISADELLIYLCTKHNLPEDVKKIIQDNHQRKLLHLAFYEKRKDLAENVKNQYPDLSLKDLIWYWGSQNNLLRFIIISFLNIRNIITKFQREDFS